MIDQYGLIGYPLSHSFSGKYFAEKFRDEKIVNARYDLWEIADISEVETVFKKEGLQGFNITIPYKQAIKKYLHNFDSSAEKVGAVNVVKINPDGKRTGYNSDYYGFETSLKNWVQSDLKILKALVLGTGGASKAVEAVFSDNDIDYKTVSRTEKGDFTYEDFESNSNLMEEYKLIVNTTPLGMSPHTNKSPQLPYSALSESHYLYDLIYNPTETLFLKLGKEKGAHIKNGHEMLVLQAEKSWEIWNS